MRFKHFGKFAAFFYIAAILGVTVFCTIKDANKNLKKEVVIEAGSHIKIEDFFNELPDDARFVTDISGIDTRYPAVYKLTVFYDEAFEKDVILRIEDHTGPKGIALPKEHFTKVKWPEAYECVGYLYDLSGIASIEYQDGVPDVHETGDYLIPVVVTDWYNNSTVIEVPFHVVDDVTPPVIRGIHDLESNGNPDEIDFYNSITVVDDYDPFPIMKVDDSQVNWAENGVYEVYYKAIDKVGNMSSYTAKLTVTLPVEGGGSSEGSGGGDGGYYGNSSGDPYPLANRILANLYGSNDVATARNIFNWVHNHIYYQTVYGSQSYTSAAYRGFSRRNGDCYVYYCCAKMLLDQAGIPNMMVRRYPVTGNGHYWNLVYLNGEWYHCDATVFRGHPSVYFMCTDDQISDSYHHFNGSLYPARAGGSKEFASPTPDPEPTQDPNVSPTPTVDPSQTTTPTPGATITPGPTTPDPNVTGTPTVTITPAITDTPTITPEPVVTEAPVITETPPDPVITEAPPPPPPTQENPPENGDTNGE